MKATLLLFAFLLLLSSHTRAQNFTSYKMNSYNCALNFKQRDTVIAQCKDDSLKLMIVKYGQACPAPQTKMSLTSDTLKVFLKDTSKIACGADCPMQYNYTLLNLPPKKYILAIDGKYYVFNCTKTGISETSIQESNYVLFPNPASTEIYLRRSSADLTSVYSKIKVLNGLGQVVYFRQVSGSDNRIDISFLQSGLYFIEIADKDLKSVASFVKE